MKSSSFVGEAAIVDETKSKSEAKEVREAQLISIDTEDTEEKSAKPGSPTQDASAGQLESPEHMEEPGSGAASPMTTSITTGSAHTLEGTQIYENRAYDEGLSISGSEQATDVSYTSVFIGPDKKKLAFNFI